MPERMKLRQLMDSYNAATQDTEREAISRTIHDEFELDRTVLIIDMSGFTRITEARGIVHFLAMIRRMQASVEPIVGQFQGSIAKMEADNVFALFEHPADALRAALESRRVLTARNRGRPDDEKVIVSAGIAHGRVLKIGDHDLWGPAVNRASKLGEDLATAGQILIDGEARWMVDSIPGFGFSAHNAASRRLGFPVFRVITRGPKVAP